MASTRHILESQREEVHTYLRRLEQQIDQLRLRNDRLRYAWQGEAAAQFQMLSGRMLARFEAEIQGLHILLREFDAALQRFDAQPKDGAAEDGLL